MSVYFIQAEDGGPIKIGYAADATKRLSTIQTGHHGTLVLRRVIRGDRRKELEMHMRYASAHIRGEWFRPVGPLCAYANCLPEIMPKSPPEQGYLADWLSNELLLCGVSVESVDLLDALACCGLVLASGTASAAYFDELEVPA